MKKTEAKKFVGKYCVVYWEDPKTFIAEYLWKVKKNPWGVHRNNGLVRDVDRDYLILEHDRDADDIQDGDYTTVKLVLITRIEKIKQ